MTARFPHSPGTAPLSPVGAVPTFSGDLWQVYRYVDYFKREQLAVFADSGAAVDFCLAESPSYPNGCYVGEYRIKRDPVPLADFQVRHLGQGTWRAEA